MNKSIYEKATDKNIITKQVVINTPTSARLLPITADEKVIDEIQQALNELERLKKQEKLLEKLKERRNKMTYAQQRCLDILDNIEKLLEPLTIDLRLDLYELRDMITNKVLEEGK